jgi:hypothetical protein
MAKLFGFSIDSDDQKPKSIVSPVPPNNEDGVDYFIQSGFYGQYVDIEGVYRTEYDLIRRYREMALHPECYTAIENVVNEAIVSDLYDSPVEIELSNLNASDRLKEIIRAEFKKIKEMMDFDKKSHEIFRNWYIDGRLFYLKVIDQKNPEGGIQELRYIDPMKMKHIRQEKKLSGQSARYKALRLRPGEESESYNFPEIEEYFVYTPTPNYPTGTISGGSKKGVKIAKDTVTYCTCGLVDRNKGTVLSPLHRAIKALNQLRMIEDSLVIYRLSRAPERRIFYIDVGNLPKVKAEQYLKEVMSRYRNKLVYDAQTGEIRDDRKFMSMLEDFWLARREGGRGTEITTLPGGQNLGELTDVQYFEKKLYRALGIPESRIAGSGDGFNLGRSSEILRDELMFSKYVGRLRKKFSNLFTDILRTQLLLKNIVSPQDWDTMCDHIQYDFLYDNHFAELKEAELLTNRLTLATTIEPYIGKYYSTEYVRKKILRQTDSEIIEIDAQIEDEIAKGILPNPNAPVDEMGNPIPQEGQPGIAVPQPGIEQSPTGEVPIEPSVNTSAIEIPKPKGGKI